MERAVEVVEGRGALRRPERVVDGPHRVRRRSEVLGQEGRLLHRDLGAAGFDGQADPAVQLLPVAREHRAVHDLAEPGLLEAVQLAVRLHDPRRGEALERAVDVDLLREDRAEERGIERPADDRRRVQDPALGRGDGVDPAEEQLLQGIGQGGPVGQVDQRA